MIKLKLIMIAVGVVLMTMLGAYMWWLQRSNESLTAQLASANSKITLLQDERKRSAKAQQAIIKHDSQIKINTATIKRRIAKQDDEDLPHVIREALKEIEEK